MKRLVVINDTHCGHFGGLTPPAWQLKRREPTLVRQRFSEWERKTWDWFGEAIERSRPFDALVWNGDIIDGIGERSGGTELLMTDRIDQLDIAEDIYRFINPPAANFIYGTPYHVGKGEDWERILADRLDVHIGEHDWIKAEGVVIDFKHKVSTSAMPYGRHTGPSRSRVWNALWAEREMQPKAQLVVRAHAHYYDFSGDITGATIVAPALQGWTKFGGKECEGTVDFGFLTIECEDGRWGWTPHIMDLRFAAAKARSL